MSAGLLTENAPLRATTTNYTGWTRPGDWLALPTVNDGDQKIVILCAVLPGDQSYVAFTISGACTIDWGDGAATQNVAAATQVNKQLLWASYGAETLTERGYRQAIVTITPQAANNFTSLNFEVRHSTFSVAYDQCYLDMKVGAPNCTTWTGWGSNTSARRMEQFEWVGTNSVSNWANAMRSSGVRRIAGTWWIGSATAINNMFNLCPWLETGPTFAGTSTAVTTTSSMFDGCTRLRSVTLWDTSGVTNATSMFNGCSSLTSVPLFVLSAVTNAATMFSGCISLASVPLFNLSALQTATSMFSACSALQTVPAFTGNLSTVINASSLFGSCTALQTVPAFALTVATTTNQMFISCASLQSAPITGCGSVTDMTSMFNNCSSLASVGAFSMASMTTSTSMFSSCSRLATMSATGATRAFSVASCFLNAAALDTLYTNLGTAAGTQAITVTSNPGTTGDTPTIATAKGWTVTGS